MKSSFHVGTLAGIDLKLHFTFPLILILGAVQWMDLHGAAGAAFGALLMLGLYGLISGQILLALVALFVFLGAGQERAAEEARALLSTLVLGDAYNKHALTLAPGDRIDRVIDYLLTSYQPDFAVLHGGRLLGVVTRERVFKHLIVGDPDGYVTSIMDREVPRFEPGLSLAEVHERMAQQEISVAAVFEGDHFLGLVNLDDLREALQIVAFQQVASRRPEDGQRAA